MSNSIELAKIKRRGLLPLAAMFLIAAFAVVAPHAAQAEVTAKYHDTIYGTDLVLVASVSQGAKQAAIGITKDNVSPLVLFADLASWNQFVALWNRAKSTPPSDTKQKIGTFIDMSSGNVMGIDVGKDGIFFFITDSNSTQLFVLKKADQAGFDNNVRLVSQFLGG